MFEYIRTHKRVMQGVLLVIIFPSFAFFGVESFMRSQGADNAVATVGGQPISRQEFDQALRTQLDRLKQSYGQEFDAQLLNTPEARKGVVDDLVSRRVVMSEAAKSNLTVTDQTLQQTILDTPGLKKEDNTFDSERYKSLLAMQSMTPAMYESSLRQDMVMQQLVNSVQSTAFSARAVNERIALISEQERDVQAIRFEAKDFASQVKITDQMLRAFYDKNAAQFEIPEQVSAEYVVLSSDALSEQIVVADAEAQALYESKKTNYTTDEQRRASHILLNLKKDASEAEVKAVKAKAQSLLEQVRKNPESFAKVAKENSQDSGSAVKGGDLDFFGRGAMVKAFDDTVFKLKVGEISDLVQSEFGIHIIQLTAINASKVKSFDEVKAQLVAEIKKQKASKAYAEAAESFTNLVSDQADSLKPVAEKFKLKIEKIANLSRKPSPAAPAGMIANNPKFIKAIFSDESLKKKFNTDAIEIAPSTLVSGRIVEYKAASKRPFEEVKAMIELTVKQSEALALAKKAGATKLTELKKADSAAGFSDIKTVSRAKKSDLPSEALFEVMKADVQKLPAYVGVDLPNLGYEVYRIAKVTAGVPDPARRVNEVKQIENAVAQQDMFAYLESIKQRAKVVINQAALNSKAAADSQ
jgi:peptidyl-prolyl cis-trans isomerase D